jgi:Tol biopolymer transport system component
VANPSGNLWTVPITDAVAGESAVERFAVPTVRAVSPRWARDCLIYLSSTTGADGIWRFKDGAAAELWKGSDGAVTDIPTVSPDGAQLCFTRRRDSRSGLFLMKTGGSEPQPIAPSLDVRGSAAWSPDGQWIAVAAETPQGDRLYKVNLKGGDPQVLIPRQSYNPVWSPDGEVILYEEALSGSTHTIKAVTAEGLPIHTPPAQTRSGGHRIAFLGPRTAVVLLGQFRAQDFWLLDLSSGKLRRLTSLKPGYAITAFDILPDGRTILFDRNRENSDIVLIDLPTE